MYSFYREHPRVMKFYDPEDSVTIQSDAEAADINNILDKYRRTGILEHIQTRHAQYGDFSEIGDYQEKLNTVMAVTEVFNSLPVDVREEFDNDPANFIEYASQQENRERLSQLGLEKAPKTDVSSDEAENVEKPQESPDSED